MEKKERKTFFEKLDELPSWVFFVVPFVIIAAPIIYPIGTPVKISDYTIAANNVVNNLPEGSVVVYQHGIGPVYWDSTGAGMVAMYKLLWSKNAKVITFTTVAGAEAVPMLKAITMSEPEKFGKKYGEDYVTFSLAAGDEVGMASFASDIWKTFPVDYYGKATDTLPLMKNVRSAKDVDLLVATIPGWPYPDQIARQWSKAYGTPIVGILAWGIVPITLPYYPTQIQGLVIDVEGGAELERLTGFLGLGTSLVDAKSIGGFVIFFVFLLANVVMIGLRYERRKTKQ